VDSILKRGGGVFFVFFLDRSNAPSLDFLCKFLSEDFEMGRTPGTCKWILNHSAFTDWCENTDSEARLLLIYGNPASRKSVVSSFIIDHLILEGRQCQYFFIRFTDQHEQSLHTILRSVAYQIARTIPAYSDKILQLFCGRRRLEVGRCAKHSPNSVGR
jgi:hypothetical protein